MTIPEGNPDTFDDLIAEYDAWRTKIGRPDLGSADEHLFDESLTEDQRAWLFAFYARWDNVVEG